MHIEEHKAIHWLEKWPTISNSIRLMEREDFTSRKKKKGADRLMIRRRTDDEEEGGLFAPSNVDDVNTLFSNYWTVHPMFVIILDK